MFKMAVLQMVLWHENSGVVVCFFFSSQSQGCEGKSCLWKEFSLPLLSLGALTTCCWFHEPVCRT